jgi:hypothetical protein
MHAPQGVHCPLLGIRISYSQRDHSIKKDTKKVSSLVAGSGFEPLTSGLQGARMGMSNAPESVPLERPARSARVCAAGSAN